VNGRPAPDDRLSAYLDGELDAAERADVAGYLAESPEWR
jgi:anti-sigma factor RsiW